MLIMILAALQAAATPTSQPATQPAPADWRTRPITAGVWTWRASTDFSEAAFSDARGVQLVVRCTRADRRVSFSRTGAGPTVPIRIATTSSERQLGPGNMVLAGDPLLDAFAFSRGRLWVEARGLMPLVLRSAAEPARAIEDCRS